MHGWCRQGTSTSLSFSCSQCFFKYKSLSNFLLVHRLSSETLLLSWTFSADNKEAEIQNTTYSRSTRCHPLGKRCVIGPKCILYPVTLFDGISMQTSQGMFLIQRGYFRLKICARCHHKYLDGDSSDGKIYLLTCILWLTA